MWNQGSTLVITFHQILLGIFKAHLYPLFPRNKEGWKEEKARVGNEAVNTMSSALRLCPQSLPLASPVPQPLSSDPGLSFVTFSLFYMEGPCIYESYMWEQMGTCVYAYLSLRFFFLIIWKNKDLSHSKPPGSLPVLSEGSRRKFPREAVAKSQTQLSDWNELN